MLGPQGVTVAAVLTALGLFIVRVRGSGKDRLNADAAKDKLDAQQMEKLLSYVDSLQQTIVEKDNKISQMQIDFIQVNLEKESKVLSLSKQVADLKLELQKAEIDRDLSKKEMKRLKRRLKNLQKGTVILEEEDSEAEKSDD
ncbi:MAG: hypothetical protein KDH96_12405 [Candidatus Riesia sp.]|nr:hypothetical protein [Candidatus Riesia sp.]